MMRTAVEWGFRGRSGIKAIAPMNEPQIAARKRVIDALEIVLLFDTDREMRKAARRRYCDLTDKGEA